LNEEDIQAIEFAANTLEQFRGIGLFKTSGDAIDKILGRLSLRPENGLDTDSYVQFETAPAYRGTEHLASILRAIREKRRIRFAYSKYTGGKTKTYQLDPYLLKEYRNRWYVIGRNPEKEAVVIFGLDRIEGLIEEGGERFERQADFDPDRYFKHSIGITAIDDVPQEIHLRFSPLTGKYVESQPLHHSQKLIRNDETALDVSLYLCITHELLMQILSYGADVEVLKPASLRAQIQRELRNALKGYTG
jgi:predicted DNA-binding transcriptional regulator YafY